MAYTVTTLRILGATLGKYISDCDTALPSSEQATAIKEYISQRRMLGDNPVASYVADAARELDASQLNLLSTIGILQDNLKSAVGLVEDGMQLTAHERIEDLEARYTWEVAERETRAQYLAQYVKLFETVEDKRLAAKA